MIALLLLVQGTEAVPADTLRAAFKRSIALGGLTVKGKITSEEEDSPGGIIMNFGDADFTGDFEARLDASGTAHVKADRGERGSIEIYGRGDKWVKRATWVGDVPPIDGFAREALSLIDLAHWRDNLNRLKNVKAGADDGDCLTFTAEAPEEILIDEPTDDDGLGAVMSDFDFWQLESIETKIWVDKADHRLSKIEVTITHGVSDQVVVGGGPDFSEMTKVRVVKLDGFSFDEGLKVEVPADVKKLLPE